MAKRSATLALLLLIPVFAAGCAPSMHASSGRPIPRVLSENSPFLLRGLSAGDAWLRHYLMQNDPASALEILESPADRPTSDQLLLALNQAIIHRQAGEFAESNALLEWADQEAERRHVRSASQTAASFLINDRVLSYTPTATERAMIPYYRTMNYLELGDVDAAAVEARRISALLSTSNGDALRRCRGDAMFNHLAGLVFERAGEWNDAVVSLRRAEADYGMCASAGLIAPDVELPVDLIRVASAAGLYELADSLAAVHPEAVRPLAADSAEVILFVERGFIAHRAEESLSIPLYADDIAGLDSDDEIGIAEVAANVVARLAYGAGDPRREGRSWDDGYRRSGQVGRALEVAHVLRLAWPTLYSPEVDRALSGPRLVIGGVDAALNPVGNLSTLAMADLEAERPAMLARLVTRSLAKYLISREVESRAERKGGEVLGFVAGRLMNIAANETERADTRSWTLLPAEIQMVRQRVPAGAVAVGSLGRVAQYAASELDPEDPGVLAVALEGAEEAALETVSEAGAASESAASEHPGLAAGMEAGFPEADSVLTRVLNVPGGQRGIFAFSLVAEPTSSGLHELTHVKEVEQVPAPRHRNTTEVAVESDLE